MRTKTRKRRQKVNPNTVEKMVSLFKKNLGRLILRDELGRDFLAGDDPKILRTLSCGYIPKVRDALEDHNGHTLENVPRKGWIFCEGGIHTFRAVRANEKRLTSSKNKLSLRLKTLILDKFSENVRSLIEAKKGMDALVDTAISQQNALTDRINKLLTEEER